MVLTNENS